MVVIADSAVDNVDGWLGAKALAMATMVDKRAKRTILTNPKVFSLFWVGDT
jgi:hypothetical protein